MNDEINREALRRMFPGWVASQYSQALRRSVVRGKAMIMRCAACYDAPEQLCTGVAVQHQIVVRKDVASGVILWR
jgi:hypothetical protein